MNSPIDNLIERIEKLILNEVINPNQISFLQNIKFLLKNYRIEPGQFSDMLFTVYDIEKNVKK